MGQRDNRVDLFIAKSAEFAKPILEQIRETVHKACPEVEETIKWGMPFYEYKGILCFMAAFKKHCAFGIAKSQLLDDPDNILTARGDGAMGNLRALTSVKELPSQRILIKYIKQAAKLNEAGVKVVKKKPAKKKELVVPASLEAALKKNKKASAVFQAFSYSHKKEYIEWITEAKTEETRLKRLNAAVEMMSEGKSRNWKYQKK